MAVANMIAFDLGFISMGTAKDCVVIINLPEVNLNFLKVSQNNS